MHNMMRRHGLKVILVSMLVLGVLLPGGYAYWSVAKTSEYESLQMLEHDVSIITHVLKQPLYDFQQKPATMLLQTYLDEPLFDGFSVILPDGVTFISVGETPRENEALRIPMIHKGEPLGMLLVEVDSTELAKRAESIPKAILQTLSWQLLASVLITSLLFFVYLLRPIRNLVRQFETLPEHLNTPLEHVGNNELSSIADAGEQMRRRIVSGQSQIVESEKLASMGLLVASVAHEMNTPLGVVLTSTSQLDMQIARLTSYMHTGKVKRGEMESILEDLQQLSTLSLSNAQRVEETLQALKSSAYHREVQQLFPFEMQQLFDEESLTLKTLLKKGEHRLEVTPTRCALVSYRGVVAQLLTILVDNAAKHAFLPDTKGTVTLSCKPVGEDIEIMVSDDGKGMDSETLSSVFEPFYTTKPDEGGTGLGLHIARTLAQEKLQGSLECHSEPGVGTRFVLKLPKEMSGEV